MGQLDRGLGLLIFFFVSVGSASGGGEEAASGGHSSAPAAAKAPPEWVEVQNRLQTLKAKLAAKEKTVRELIANRHHDKSHETFENLKKEHSELRQLAEEYEQQRNVLKYRYPEKGMQDGRKYRRVIVKPLDEMEYQVSLESRLQKLQGKVHRQYSSEAQEGAVKGLSEPRGPASLKDGKVEDPLTVPAVMSK